MPELDWWEISLRLVLAGLFGAAIGLERERKEWAAGMRTHMMVCVGSALMMLVSSFGFSDILGSDFVELDPSRVASQIISGIGFIGAGTILFQKPNRVMGLTTASGLWTVAGIGMATGGGMYFAASAATVLSLLILWGMQPVQKRFSAKFYNKNLRIFVKPETDTKEIIDRLLEDKNIEFANFSVTKTQKETIIELYLEKANKELLSGIVDTLSRYPSVKTIKWNK